MEQTNRPSKQFLIRGGVATLVLALLLIVQTNWFQNLFRKDPIAEQPKQQTVGELLTKDSNKNGIADWEEKMWGLDPTALYTNGVPNKTVIEQKKLALGVNDTDNNTPENETDALARELITIATALGQEGQSPESLAAIGKKMAESVKIQAVNRYYGLKDLQTVPTTVESLNLYYKDFTRLLALHNKNLPEIDILLQSFETGSFENMPELLTTKENYEQFAKTLVGIRVPVGLQYEHLEMVNSLYAIGASLNYLAQVSDNAINSLAGIALYRTNDQRLSLAAQKIVEYMQQYGILQ